MSALLLTADAGWCGGSELERDVDVLVTEDRAVWRPVTVPEDVRRLYVDGVLLRGLVDHHVHAELVDLPAVLRGGICGVRDLGGDPVRTLELAVLSRSSARIPHLSAAGPFLTVSGGYPTDRPWATQGMWQTVPGPEAGAGSVADLAGRGAELIKVALNTTAGPVLGAAALRAIIEAAHAHGLPVVAHAEGPAQAERAGSAGVDELAHTPWTHRLDDEAIRRLAARTRWVSTLDIHGWGSVTPELRTALDNLRRFHAAGGRVVYGTDLGNGPLPAGVNRRELAGLAEAGLAAIDILRSIAVSAHGVTVVDADPLSDPLVISRPSAVAKAGRLLEGATP